MNTFEHLIALVYAEVYGRLLDQDDPEQIDIYVEMLDYFDTEDEPPLPGLYDPDRREWIVKKAEAWEKKVDRDRWADAWGGELPDEPDEELSDGGYSAWLDNGK